MSILIVIPHMQSEIMCTWARGVDVFEDSIFEEWNNFNLKFLFCWHNVHLFSLLCVREETFRYSIENLKLKDVFKCKKQCQILKIILSPALQLKHFYENCISLTNAPLKSFSRLEFNQLSPHFHFLLLIFTEFQEKTIFSSSFMKKLYKYGDSFHFINCSSPFCSN